MRATVSGSLARTRTTPPAVEPSSLSPVTVTEVTSVGGLGALVGGRTDGRGEATGVEGLEVGGAAVGGAGVGGSGGALAATAPPESGACVPLDAGAPPAAGGVCGVTAAGAVNTGGLSDTTSIVS